MDGMTKTPYAQSVIDGRQTILRRYVANILTQPIMLSLRDSLGGSGAASRGGIAWLRALNFAKVAIVDGGALMLNSTIWDEVTREMMIPWDVHYDRADKGSLEWGSVQLENKFYRTVREDSEGEALAFWQASSLAGARFPGVDDRMVFAFLKWTTGGIPAGHHGDVSISPAVLRTLHRRRTERITVSPAFGKAPYSFSIREGDANIFSVADNVITLTTTETTSEGIHYGTLRAVDSSVPANTQITRYVVTVPSA